MPISALDALNTWVRFAVRTPRAPLPTNQLPGRGVPAATIAQGRGLFQAAGCASCHFGSTFTLSVKDFASPPAAAELATETAPAPPAGVTPVGAQFLARFLRDIGSFNLGVPGAGNPLGANIGAPEKTTAALVNGVSQAPLDALGFDHNHGERNAARRRPDRSGTDADRRLPALDRRRHAARRRHAVARRTPRPCQLASVR